MKPLLVIVILGIVLVNGNSCMNSSEQEYEIIEWYIDEKEIYQQIGMSLFDLDYNQLSELSNHSYILTKCTINKTENQFIYKNSYEVGGIQTHPYIITIFSIAKNKRIITTGFILMIRATQYEFSYPLKNRCILFDRITPDTLDILPNYNGSNNILDYKVQIQELITILENA